MQASCLTPGWPCPPVATLPWTLSDPEALRASAQSLCPLPFYLLLLLASTKSNTEAAESQEVARKDPRILQIDSQM